MSRFSVTYTVFVVLDEEGWYVASAPVPGVAAQGRTPRTALRAIRKALGAYIAVRRRRGWTIPRETEAAVSEMRIAV
jgi:predicted RNase H-like HicB family nuclease